jgi:hypothetical protein
MDFICMDACRKSCFHTKENQYFGLWSQYYLETRVKQEKKPLLLNKLYGQLLLQKTCINIHNSPKTCPLNGS